MSDKAYLTVFINPKTLVVEDVRILSDNLPTYCGQIPAIAFEMSGESFHDASERMYEFIVGFDMFSWAYPFLKRNREREKGIFSNL